MRNILTLAGAALLSSCGGDTETEGGGGAGGGQSAPCQFAPGDHSALCNGPSCAVVSDGYWSCPVNAFPQLLKVAPTTDRTYVASVRQLAVLSGDGGQSRDFGIPETLFRRAFFPVVTPAGDALAAYCINVDGGEAGSVMVAPIEGGEHQTVYTSDAGDGAPDLIDFEAALDGNLSLWLWSKDQPWLAQYDGAHWTLEPAAAMLLGVQRALANDGRVLEFHYLESDTASLH
ncbi:MAG: hypothetical protein JRI68_17595, partial [Deltaproteobacteria bacterium]|nr:hypothetical protein [Deltaproteobacteria bacterium]